MKATENQTEISQQPNEDYYDIWLPSEQISFDGEALKGRRQSYRPLSVVRLLYCREAPAVCQPSLCHMRVS